MTTKPLMLEGLLPEEDKKRDGFIHEWRKEKQRLEEEVRGLRHDLDEAQAKNETLERSLRNLRRQLSPLHNALRAVFGEIELAVGEEQYAPAANGAGPQSESRTDPRWESWKAKIPGRPAEMIDLLLLHKSMGTKALMSAMHCAKDTVYGSAKKLNAAGLLATSQPYSLRQLE